MSKTILNTNDITKIIDLYQATISSTHELAKQFKVGHKKITRILKENNIKINKRGAQEKDGKSRLIEKNKTLSYSSNDNLVAVCKKTKKEFKDINNLSGILTNHILKTYPNANIPINNYQRKKYELYHNKKWFEEYFDIIEIPTILIETRKCKLCDWETKDIDNKTGCFEQHINKIHKISLNNYLNQYPEDIIFHKNHIKQIEYNKTISNKENYVICKLCNKKMKSITNTHLIKKHNITSYEYKLRFPNEKLTSVTLTNKFRKQAIVTNMNIEPTWTSSGEIEIMNFIKELGFDVKKGKNRKLLNGKEIDLIIEDKKICIEYNGLYYHTERMGKNSMYHLNKTMECNNIGYGLIHIFEDEWILKKEMIKNKLKYILNVADVIKIGARNINIKKITSKEKSKFLDENHLQGNDNSIIYYGAFYKNELIGVMTFNSKRNMTKNINNQYELSRFGVKENYSVAGLGSKFVQYFIKEYNPDSIISFADRRWTLNGTNNFYIKMGFKLIDIIRPTYYYYNSKVNRYKRYHKFGFGKNSLKKKYPNLNFNKTEKELMSELGYDRIWDCGLFKYEMNYLAASSGVSIKNQQKCKI